jgi:hypothetical protein
MEFDKNTPPAPLQRGAAPAKIGFFIVLTFLALMGVEILWLGWLNFGQDGKSD